MINRKWRSVTVYRSAARVTILADSDELSGEDVVDALRYFMLDPAEDPEVRAYLASTGLKEEIVSVPLKGLEGDHVLHRIRPVRDS